MKISLRIVNALLYIAACLLLASGLALELKIEIEDEGKFLFGLNGEAWGEVHFILGLVVASLTVLHLGLNWGWIQGLLARMRWPVIAVLALGVLLIGGVLLAPVSSAGQGNKQAGQHHD